MFLIGCLFFETKIFFPQPLANTYHIFISILYKSLHVEQTNQLIATKSTKDLRTNMK